MKFLKKGKAKDGETHREECDVESENHLEQAPPAKIKEPIVIHKFGIADRLNDAVSAMSTCAEKRSPDLVPLSKEFDVFRKQLRQLTVSAKQYHVALCKMNNQRNQMANDICFFAKAAPIEKAVCSTNKNHSFLAVYTKASRDVDSRKYEEDILEYLAEWEHAMTRVDQESAEVEKLRKAYMHYQTKVDSLRKKVNASASSGKETNEATAEKLKRNEEKLDDASKEFEDAARLLCVLIEEVVRHGWKDVLPLVQSLMVWETTRSKIEASVFSEWKPSHSQDGRGSWIEVKQSNNTDAV